MLSGINEDLALPLLAQRPTLKPSATPHRSVEGKRVLVTGAGGSIGSELVRQIARSKPERLILVDSHEYALYEISMTLDVQKQKIDQYPYLVDVRDHRGLSVLFRNHKPDVVFHAAALKHVPLLENDTNLVEAVKTNVGGTKNVAELCALSGAEMVFISTDKAVNPSSGMGLTKRCAEILCHGLALQHPSASIRQVRFGNVMGSSGSVIPLFRRQIAKGGPITITHPEMTRFMMSISEAVQLVLSAADDDAQGYACYVLDMGEPVKIMDLARQLVVMAGLTPGEDIEFETIGFRPGEKMHEELSYAWERLEPSPFPRVNRAFPDYDPLTRMADLDTLMLAANKRAASSMKSLLSMIVPEYSCEVSY